jgi:hypothetical protein
MSDKIFTVPGIKARRISAPVNTSSVGQTADWSSIGRNIAQAGASIAAGIQAGQTDLQIAEGQIEKGKKPANKLQAKIDRATAEGKDAKAARLQGRKDRRDERDTKREARIKKRNEERLETTQQRQENKTNRFDERREDGNTPISSFSQVFDKFSTIAKNL